MSNLLTLCCFAEIELALLSAKTARERASIQLPQTLSAQSAKTARERVCIQLPQTLSALSAKKAKAESRGACVHSIAATQTLTAKSAKTRDEGSVCCT